MQKILVTGADGFIGSHLTEELVKQGNDVTAFVWYNQFNSHGLLNGSKFASDIRFVSGDVRDYDSVRSAFAGMDLVFHLAALNAIPHSYDAPDSYLRTNTEGTLNVLRAAMHGDVPKLVVTSTSEVYGTAQFVPISEDHPIRPQSPYAASKAAADAFAEAFFRSYGQQVIVVRPFNTYGPRQSMRAIIPTIIAQALKHNTIELGNLSPTRDFVYVKDTVKGFIELAMKAKPGEGPVNIATMQEISIDQLVTTILSKLGFRRDADIKVTSSSVRVRPTDSEVERLCGSNVKLRRITEWIPGTSLDAGLHDTIQWIEENLESLTDVREYVK